MILYYIILYRNILYYIVLYRIILYYIILYYIISYYIIVFSDMFRLTLKLSSGSTHQIKDHGLTALISKYTRNALVETPIVFPLNVV